jgi:trehalose synthase
MSDLISEVHVGVRDLRRFEPILGVEAVDRTFAEARRFSALLDGRVVWNINSTAVGGGVAEMLQPLLGYARGAGVDTRWLVIGGSPEFFELTKRIHHALHGSAGDGRPLDDAARAIYEESCRNNAAELLGMIQPGDFVILHDPQTAGLASALMSHGANVVWRCHIGEDEETEEGRRGWDFLRPYLEDVPAFVFSRASYAPPWVPAERLEIVQPSIDAFSAKNQELSDAQVRSIVVHTGLVEGPMPEDADLSFRLADGSPSRVEARADVVRVGRAPAVDEPLVVQISRWDPLKDMGGVMEGFARACASSRIPGDAHLLLAGPDVRTVADDPEAPAVFDAAVERSRNLPQGSRHRVHLVNLPTGDIEENAAIVNALQRHATVVVQKSLQEGFGLTVTEAMWKARPVLASAVGGIQDQITSGVHGLLLDDPRDLDGFSALLGELFDDREHARRMGEAAHERVREQFLAVRHLLQYASLLTGLDAH